jgi:hypothetical protein
VKIDFEVRRGLVAADGSIVSSFPSFGAAAMPSLRDACLQALMPRKKPAKESSFASWADRAYFLAGYFSALCAVGLILFSVFFQIDPSKETREHKGWNLEQPEPVEHHSLGE